LRKKASKLYVPQTFHLVAEARSSAGSESVTYCFSKAEFGVTTFNRNIDDKQMKKMGRNAQKIRLSHSQALLTVTTMS
jgi:hypothetical protein